MQVYRKFLKISVKTAAVSVSSRPETGNDIILQQRYLYNLENLYGITGYYNMMIVLPADSARTHTHADSLVK